MQPSSSYCLWIKLIGCCSIVTSFVVVTGRQFSKTFNLLRFCVEYFISRICFPYYTAQLLLNLPVFHIRLRWPSILDFLGQSGYLTTCLGKKSQFSWDVHLSCFVFSLVSWICPDLPISAAVCLRIGGQKLAQILSVYTKKSLAAGALPQTLLGDLTTLPETPSQTPDGSRLWRSHPTCTIHTFSAHPGLRCPNHGHLTVCTVVQDCCKGRSNKYRKWQFWGSCRPETP